MQERISKSTRTQQQTEQNRTERTGLIVEVEDEAADHWHDERQRHIGPQPGGRQDLSAIEVVDELGHQDRWEQRHHVVDEEGNAPDPPGWGQGAKQRVPQRALGLGLRHLHFPLLLEDGERVTCRVTCVELSEVAHLQRLRGTN